MKQVLKNSCYSCHSNETKLPWFDKVVPAYWVVSSDVKEARRHLNFSEIGKLPAAQQKGFLFEAVNMIQLGAMPLPSYLRVHPNAAVTPEQLAVLRNYLVPPTAGMGAPVVDTSAADAEYEKWIQANKATGNAASGAALRVQPEFNGVAFLPDYKNWKAIAESHINPWPDGTAFAKVAWLQSSPDEKGVVRTGPFIQVEFMIKDARKYESTEGWGFGRWRGADLKPYGKDAAFQNECTSCHAPLRKNDYVYTMPFGGQQ